MAVIILELLGDVCLDYYSQSGEHLRYDVPTDPLGLPYIPMYSALEKQGISLDGIQIGLGRLMNYDGLVCGVRELLNCEEFSPRLVLDNYTKIYQLKDDRGRFVCRVLKRGLVFEAEVCGDDERLGEFSRALEGIDRIGFTNYMISGKVKMTLLRSRPGTASTRRAGHQLPPLVKDKEYYRLDYVIETSSPLCIFSPFEIKDKCKSYIPGEVLLDFIREHIDSYYDGEFETGRLRVSNAYPEMEGTRSLPAPDAMTLQKLNKKVLHNRLAPSPGEAAAVQTVRIDGQFVARFAERTIERCEPQLVRIHPVLAEDDLSGRQSVRNAIGEGQRFSGFMTGSDEQIRALYRLFGDHPRFSLGNYVEEGYGEVFFKIRRIQEGMDYPEQLFRTFDLYCLAPMLLYDDKGMYRYDAEALKSVVEEKLGCQGRLKVIRSFMNSAVCHRLDRRLNEDTSQVLAVAMGSAVRFGTIDDLPVNVAPIRHTFLGSGKRRGYGEILIEPPHDVFFRACRKVTLPLYQLIVLTNARDLQESMLIIRHMLKAILKLRVSMLALSDRSQDAASVEEAMGVLHLMRDLYCREISDDELMEMYREVAANEI